MHVRQFLAWVGTRTVSYVAGRGSRRVIHSRPSVAWPYYKAIRRLYNWAIEEYLVTANPTSTIHFKAPAPAPVLAYSLDEIKALLSVCERDIKGATHFLGIRNKARILLFLDAGLRLKEMATLTLSDVNLTEQYVRVLGKGNKPDFCPFSNKTRRVLWLYLAERKPRAKTSNLWIIESGGALSHDGLGNCFRDLKSRAGVTSPGGVHRLRHTAALQYLRGAKDSFLLQLFLRHSDLAMTRRYTQGLKKEEAILAHRNGASPVERMGIG
jgi:site-specific recombinase XerD